jgi:glycine oxidase
VATGHHRNGILLAPSTAKAIETLVLDGAMQGPAASFTLARFARANRNVRREQLQETRG